ncbi:hypothetical protein B0A49_07117 [Cryomyces minteri]|uniref:Uncharacterized protein n=1 Tax=Cryomyces minteri TaxID=331657 RepID=A0A4U0XDD1_9PEZI|nr:hypothetical protein B0A49_07117 [Cryomyces minteri]
MVDYQYYSTPTPVAAATTVVTVTAVSPVNATTGRGSLPDLAMITPAPASAVLTAATGTAFVATSTTPFVYYTAYALEMQRPYTFKNGSIQCLTQTQTYNLSSPFAFDYSGDSLDGFTHVSGDVPGDFVDQIPQASCVAGTWQADPTVMVVVNLIYAAEAVLAVHTELSQSTLDVPPVTTPPVIYPSAHVESTVTSTTQDQSQTVVSLIMPSATTPPIEFAPYIQPSATTLDQNSVVSTTQQRPRVSPFVAHLESSAITLYANPTDGLTAITTTVDGSQVVALPENSATGNPAPSEAPGLGVLVSLVGKLSGGSPTAAQPITSVPQALPQNNGQTALTSGNSNPNSAPALGNLISVVAQLGAGNSASGQQLTNAPQLPQQSGQVSPPGSDTQQSGVGSGQGSNDQPNLAPAPVVVIGLSTITVGLSSPLVVGSQTVYPGAPAITISGTPPTPTIPGPAPVLTYDGTAFTANPAPQYVVGGQTLVPGGPAITVSGTPVSLPAQPTAIVVGGITQSLGPPPASPSPLTVGGLTITPNSAQAYIIGSQTLEAGAPAIVVSGTSVSLAPGATAVVVGGTTSHLGPQAQITKSPVGSNPQAITVGGSTITINSASNFVVGSQTLSVGGPGITVSGTTLSLGRSGSSTFIVVDGATQALARAPVATPPLLTIGANTYTANAATQYYLAPGQTLTAGGQVTVSGTVVSLGPSASYVVVNGVTRGLSAPTVAPQPLLNVGGTQYAANAGSSYVIAGQTLTPGGVIIVDGTTISLAASESAVVVNGVTQTLASPVITPAPIVLGSSTYTANAGSTYVIGGQTLTPGGIITESGSTVSLGPSAAIVVVNGITQTLGPAAITPAPVLTVGGRTYTANAGSSYVIAGQTLTPGGVITVSGTTISLAPSAANIVVNGVKQTLASPATITAPPILTIGGMTYTANTGTTYTIAGQTLTPGGVITASGTVISLTPSATAIVVNGITTTLFPAGVVTTSAPLLTVGASTYTANAGTTFTIGGQTLTPGGVITVSGTIISLSASATIAVVGTVTETLFPATTTGVGSAYCVGPDTSCCGTLGAGVTGSDGVPGATSTVPSSSSTLQASATLTAPASGATNTDCAPTDTGDECCARLGGGNVLCGVTSAGTHIMFHCYDPSAGEECCSNLERCVGAGCCGTLGVGVFVPPSSSFSSSSSAAAAATSPSSLASGYLSTLSSTFFFRPASTATQVSTSTASAQVPVAGTSGTPSAASVSASSAPTSRTSSRTTTTTSGSSSTASLPAQQTVNAAGGGAGVEGVVAVLVGVAGLVGLL